MKKLRLGDFQLSQNYLFFYDKLNKSNYYLELAIENANRPIDDRLISHLNGDLISDGGQFDMVVNLLGTDFRCMIASIMLTTAEQYGVVPQVIHPETLHSSLSGPVNSLLKTKLREHALILRKLTTSLRSESSLTEREILTTVRSKKEELLGEIYTIMAATFGAPPRPDAEFTWDYYDTDSKPHSWTGTPRAFYREFLDKAANPADCFSLINDPRNAYNKCYTVDKLGNVWGGRPVLYVNTEIDNLKQAVVKMIKVGLPVFFGCDVGQSSDRFSGVMDTALMEYETAFNIKLGLTKAERLLVGESSMTHAMVITAVHLDDAGKPVRYKVYGPSPSPSSVV
jgi:bleomycin hydrolase